jgi:hypothetical protein
MKKTIAFLLCLVALVGHSQPTNSVKISGLPAGTTPVGNELVPVDQGGSTRSLTVAQVIAPAQSANLATSNALAASINAVSNTVGIVANASASVFSGTVGGGWIKFTNNPTTYPSLQLYGGTNSAEAYVRLGATNSLRQIVFDLQGGFSYVDGGTNIFSVDAYGNLTANSANIPNVVTNTATINSLTFPSQGGNGLYFNGHQPYLYSGAPYPGTFVKSVAPYDRDLYDSSANPSIDWGNRLFYGSWTFPASDVTNQPGFWLAMPAGTSTATNALAVGPSGSIYDAGSVTNVQANAIVGTGIPAAAVTGLLNASTVQPTNGPINLLGTDGSSFWSTPTLPSSAMNKVYTNMIVINEQFQNLTNWAVQGNATWSVTNNHLVASASTWVWGGNYLLFTNWPTAYHNWTMSCDLYPQTTNANNAFGLGIRSMNIAQNQANINGTNKTWNLFFVYDSDTGAGSVWFGPSNALTIVQGSADASEMMTPSSNQCIRATLTRQDNNYGCMFSNAVTGQFTRIGYTTDTSLGLNETSEFATNGMEPNTGAAAFFCQQGTFWPSNFLFGLNGPWPLDAVAVGDSITSGFGCPTLEDGYVGVAQLLMPGWNIAYDSAGNDSTYEVLMRIKELQALHATRTSILIGGNDISHGTSLGQIETNIALIVNALTNYTHVYLLEPTPWGTQNNGPLAAWMRTNYTGTAVTVGDFWTPLKAGYGSYLPATNFMFWDLIHPAANGGHVLGRKWVKMMQGQ